MASLTLSAVNVLAADGTTTVSTQIYVDPNHSSAHGAVVAVMLGDGSILTPGQALAAASLPVVLTAAQVAALTASYAEVTGTFNRPANTTAYSAGGSVNSSTTAPAFVAFAGVAKSNGGSGTITKIRLATNKASITPRTRVHLFNANTATLTNDGAAFIDKFADDSLKIGYYDLPAMQGEPGAGVDESRAQAAGIAIPFVCAGGTTTIYAVLETLDAFTPASGQTFNITIGADQY